MNKKIVTVIIVLLLLFGVILYFEATPTYVEYISQH